MTLAADQVTLAQGKVALAADQVTLAKGHADDASGYAQDAGQSASAAAGFAGDASDSAVLAGQRAVASDERATDAETAASTATRKAGEAATAAGTATTKAGEAETAAGTATTKASQANTSAGNAATSEQNAAQSLSQVNTLKGQIETVVQTASFLLVQQGDQPAGVLNLSAVTTSAFIHRRLTGNITGITLPTTAIAGQMITLVLTQDATGGRTLTMPAAVFGTDGLDPVLSTAPAAVDMVGLLYDGVRWWSVVPAQRGA